MKGLPFETAEQRQELRDLCSWFHQATPPDAEKFGAVAAATIPALLDALAKAEGREGGKLGEQVREALTEHFLTRLDGRSLLAMGVDVQQLGVVVLPQGTAIATVVLRLTPC